MVADLSHTQKALYEQQSYSRQLTQKLDALQAIEQRSKTAEAQLEDKDVDIKELKGQVADATKLVEEGVKQIHGLELTLAAARAQLEAQEAMIEQLRAFYGTSRSRESEEAGAMKTIYPSGKR